MKKKQIKVFNAIIIIFRIGYTSIMFKFLHGKNRNIFFGIVKLNKFRWLMFEKKKKIL